MKYNLSGFRQRQSSFNTKISIIMCILAVVTIVYLVATGKTSALRQATGYDIQTVKEELAEANDKIEELEERIEELERQRL